MDREIRQPEGYDRAADRLFEHFAGLITSGALQEGEPLPPEREIVERFGVSRTVVREALRTLASRGLIETRPRFRPVVRRPSYDAALETVDTLIGRLLVTPQDVRHLYETRILIEAALVRQAASGGGDLAELRDALEANRRAIPDNESFFRTDVAFHEALYRMAGNPILPVIMQGFSRWLWPQWSVMARDETRNRRNFDAHRAIAEAVGQGEPDMAETAMRAHLDDAWTQVAETFEDG